MGFKFVILWTDVALWLLFATLIGYGFRVVRHDTLRATWRRVLRDAPALCSSLVLLLFVGVTALDSVHFRRALPPAAGQPAGSQFYDTRTESLLDLALARQIGMRETTYSAPLAWQAITKQVVSRMPIWRASARSSSDSVRVSKNCVPAGWPAAGASARRKCTLSSAVTPTNSSNTSDEHSAGASRSTRRQVARSVSWLTTRKP